MYLPILELLLSLAFFKLLLRTLTFKLVSLTYCVS
jgi:hypothetical protein